MRFRKINEIVHLIFLFFERNVLNVGILKRKSFRIISTFFILGLIIFLTAQVYHFFYVNQSSLQQTQIVLDTYSCSVFMWTFLVFLFLKILFIKKDSFTAFTQQMPVSKHEVNIAMLIFEIVLGLIIVTILSASMVFALLIRNGMTFFTRIICNVYFICIFSFFLLELFYAIINFIFTILNLSKIKTVLNICILSTLLVVFYMVIIPKVFENILFGYVDHKSTNPILFYTVIAEKYGLIVSCIIFTIIICALATIILIIPNTDNININNYLYISKKKYYNISIFKCYVLVFLRRVDTYSYYFIALFIYFIMRIAKIDNAQFTISILALNGMYAYTQSDTIRYITLQKKYSAVKDFIYLVLSQFVYIALLSLPIIILSAMHEGNIIFCISLYLAILMAIVFFTMVGILFPAKNENPFSALIGTIVIIWVLILSLLICFVLKFNTSMLVMFMCLLTLAASGIGIVGLKRLKQSRTYAYIK